MIPTVLAGQLRQGVEDFLETTFPMSTPFFHGMMRRFLEKEGNLFKGPYLSILLPFYKLEGQREFFPRLPLPFDPYRHQVKAFERLSAEVPRSTLVATGTGSGKTECFLYPVLDHCLRHRGEPGIKAILIYPMNALASDQAGRLANLIYNNPGLRGHVTAGLYVGQKEEQPQTVMAEKKIVSEKHIMRSSPPDILLTNYKMLDYLLIRPRDRELWRNNGPETLKYLVVDELHTFDGAQGTDLACLLRRLKSRLSVPENHLCCIGISATIGSKEEQNELRTYAGEVFDEPFDHNSLITEERVSVGEFLQNSFIEYVHTIGQDQHAALKSETYPDAAAYIRGQYKLWFESEEDYDEVQLGEKLKSHQLFQNLLRILQGRVLSVPDIVDELGRVTRLTGDESPQFYHDLLTSLCTLISTARLPGEDGKLRPFLEVRVQVWIRELRRMVAEVKPEPHLCFSDDLKTKQPCHHLPVIHCRDCGSTGWGGVVKKNESIVLGHLKTFYIDFFNRNPQVCLLFPFGGEKNQLQFEGAVKNLCGKCLCLSYNEEKCPNCKKAEFIKVMVPDIVVKGQGKNSSSSDCPFCRSRSGLNILGSQAASLTSVLLGQLAASPYNSDKKMVAFSDSVQDAAHRGGFFAARTYQITFRSALAQMIAAKGEGVSLARLPRLFSAHWQGKWDQATYITNFIGPNMEWHDDFDYMRARGSLPKDSELKELVDKRLEWNIYSEFGFRSRVGRTLERSGVAVLYPDPEAVAAFIEANLEILRNEPGDLRDLEAGPLKRFVYGMLMHLKLQGGIFLAGLESYIESSGNSYLLHRLPYTPSFAPHMRTPAFLSDGSRGTFETLLGSGAKLKSWYQYWLLKNFSAVPFIMSSAHNFYYYLLKGLVEAGLLEKRQFKKNTVWGLGPEMLKVTTKVHQYRCQTCGHNVSAAQKEAGQWQGMSCLRFACAGVYHRQEPRVDYYGGLYLSADIRRLVVKEHTGLLGRDERGKLEIAFKEGRRPWDPNVLSATPTIEMGIDIGELSNVLLCSVPPGPAHYLQRIGRAGRENGNALSAVTANGKPHDLYFFAEPTEMISGKILPPGVFLEASAILERQFTAFCLDNWVNSGIRTSEFPESVGQVLNQVDAAKEDAFPYTFLQYIEDRQEQLFQRFVRLFKGVLKEGSIKHLRLFAAGDKTETGSLGFRILSNLSHLAQERKSYKNQVQVLNRQIKRKHDDPVQDKNHEIELDQLKTEQSALQELIGSINGKAALNFFTDEGLIPNYTFPEAGVLLKSVIYRRRSRQWLAEQEGSEGVSRYRHWVYEYDRPARSAISELAPANSFFAGGRKVTIERVDLSQSRIEHWRFCPRCTYSEHIDVSSDRNQQCPRCGTAMWRDAGQVHPMLRMRQVFANTSDKDSRISDDKDQRDPLFYHKQMLVDVQPGDIWEAFKVKDDKYPFGFEFLQKANFREVNFGRQGVEGGNSLVAGQESVRPGFTICTYCGSVQPVNKDKHTHALGCTAPEKEDPDTFNQCLYLYREFSSEAIRILLPISEAPGPDKKLHSFIAALHLGLKRKFGGAVDHLQTTLHEEPLAGLDASTRRKYLVLYDQVPGGTGYLKQLMRSQFPLMEVLEKSFAALHGCDCGRDAGKDGCYRCLLAFRTSYDMENTSRTTAMGMIKRILEYRDQMVSTANLREVPIETLDDSELETRFLEALFLYSQRENEPPVKIVKGVVNGKNGFNLTVGVNTYRVEQQVTLGPAQGVSISSRADFVFWPQRIRTPDQSDTNPMVLFTDGFHFHRNRVGQDTAQRMAIVQSHRFFVWSLTWKDVENQFKRLDRYYDHFPNPQLRQDYEGRKTGIKMYQKVVERMDAAALAGAPEKTGFQLLLKYLSCPDPQLWQRYAFANALLWLDPRRFTNDPHHEQEVAGFQTRRESLLAPVMQQYDRYILPLKVYGWLPYPLNEQEPEVECLVAVTHGKREGKHCFLNLYLEDGGEAVEHDGFERAWGNFLRLYNLMQFLPICFITTRTGLDQSRYAPLTYTRARAVTGPGETAPDPLWQEIERISDPAVHAFIPQLAQAGVPLPEVGYELQNQAGQIIAEGEMAWIDGKVVLLSSSQSDYENEFLKAGWQVVHLSRLSRDAGPLLSHLKTNKNQGK